MRNINTNHKQKQIQLKVIKRHCAGVRPCSLYNCHMGISTLRWQYFRKNLCCQNTYLKWQMQELAKTGHFLATTCIPNIHV
jgi:hypothetical protein